MLLHDVRHAVRSLRGKPGFTAVAVLTLAVGIGANSVIFSWIEATLLNPIPGVHDRGSLAALYFTTATRNDLNLSYPNYIDIRDQAVPGVAGVAVFGTGALSLRTAEGAERVWGEVVSGNMFDLLGVGAAQGRLLTPDDDRVPGGHPVVVVSDAFWQRRLGGRARPGGLHHHAERAGVHRRGRHSARLPRHAAAHRTRRVRARRDAEGLHRRRPAAGARQRLAARPRASRAWRGAGRRSGGPRRGRRAGSRQITPT